MKPYDHHRHHHPHMDWHMHHHRGHRPFPFAPIFLVFLFMFFVGWKLLFFVPILIFAAFVMKGAAYCGAHHQWRDREDFYDDDYPEKPKGKPKRGHQDDYFDDEPRIV